MFEKEQSDNQIDDAFLDMPDMEDDEKFRQWLEEEYLKEADAIEEALFDGRKFEDNQDIVEKLSVSRENFYQRAREEGLLEDTADEKAEDEKNTEEAVPESMEKKILEFRKNAGVSKDPARDANRNSGKRKHSYVRFGRIAGIAGLCLICVFAASMSSEANRKYLVNSVRILSGNDSQFITDNSSSNENASTKESDAIADIEEKLDIKMPEFYYRPYGMEFSMYEISEPTSFAYIKYKLNDTNVLFYVDKIVAINTTYHNQLAREGSTAREYKIGAMNRTANLIQNIYLYSKKIGKESIGIETAPIFLIFFQQWNYNLIKTYGNEDLFNNMVLEQSESGKNKYFRMAEKSFIFDKNIKKYISKLGYSSKGKVFMNLYMMLSLMGLYRLSIKVRTIM